MTKFDASIVALQQILNLKSYCSCRHHNLFHKLFKNTKINCFLQTDFSLKINYFQMNTNDVTKGLIQVKY